MTKIKGNLIIETVDVPCVETRAKWSTIQRQVDAGYRRFMERNGLVNHHDLRSQITSGAREAIGVKLKRQAKARRLGEQEEASTL